MHRSRLRWIVVFVVLLFALGLGLLLRWAFADSYYGVVRDLTGKEIAGATVRAGHVTTTTDKQGKFQLDGYTGTDEIIAEFNGHTGRLTLPPSDPGNLYDTANEEDVHVEWGPGDVATLFGETGGPGDVTDTDIAQVQTELDNGYFPPAPVTRRTSDDVLLPEGSVSVTIPIFLKPPVLPPLVDPSTFVVNEQGDEVVAGEILVGWKEGTSHESRQSIVEKAGGTIRFDDPLPQTTIVYVPEQKNVPRVVQKLEADDHVSVAMQNYRLYQEEAPNDPDYQSENKSWWLRKLNAEPMWEIQKNGSQVIMAVIDAGFDFAHPDLQGVFTATGLNYTTDAWNKDADHGTHVSGTIGALRNNGQGLSGITDKAVLFPVKLVDIARLPSVFAQLNTYSNVHIATMSMGWVWKKRNANAVQNGFKVHTLKEMQRFSKNLDMAIAPAFEMFSKEGGVMCKSAGNDNGLDASLNGMNFPATIVVGASGVNGGLTVFSNTGKRVDIVAPGRSIWSTKNNGTYGYMSGTSMATPIVCGTVAAIRSVRPQLGAITIKTLLRKSGRHPKALTSSYVHIDAWRALLRATNTFGVTGDVYTGQFIAVKDATIRTEPAAWNVIAGEKGEYVLPFLQRHEWFLKAQKDELKGRERIQPPHISDDVVRVVSLYLEAAEETQASSSQGTQHNADPDTGDKNNDHSSSEPTGTQDTNPDGNSSETGKDKPTGAYILENGIVVSASGCAEGGYAALEKEVGGYRECPAGFIFSRSTIACEQKTCPAGAGRTYTDECKCPDAHKGIYICGTNYMVACVPAKE